MSFEKRIWMGKHGLGLCAALTLGSVAGFCQTPPANDNFTNATVLTGTSVAFTGSLVGATLESAETNGSGPSAWAPTVWWTWTAPQSGIVTISLRVNYTWDQTWPAHSGFFEVYTGADLSSLTGISANGVTGPIGRYVAFAATAGTTYYFRAEGNLSPPLMMKLTETNGPIFVLAPQDCAVSPHSCAFFSALASAPSGIYPWQRTRYQWSYNGVSLSRHTNDNWASLVVYDVTTNNIGTYSVTASNEFGVVTSTATLSLVDTNPVPSLVALKPGNASQVPFTLTGEGGRWYKIESSQDLNNWVNPSWFQPTNATTLASVPRLGPNHFVRASLNASTDACVAQLKQMQHAQYLLAIDNQYGDSYPVSLVDLEPYLPLTAYGSITPCPDGGTYDPPATIFEAPTCSLQSQGHQLNY
jgi:hypothetical protein